MRIGFNLLYLRPGAVGGSEVYCHELIRHLADIPSTHLTLFCGASSARTFEPRSNLEIVQVSQRSFSQLGRLFDENIALLAKLRTHPVDVLMSPANIAAPLLPHRVPQVVTIHDLQHHWYPEYFPPATRRMRTMLMQASIMRADKVVAISDFTRRDLIKRYNVPGSKVETVLEGVDRGWEANAASFEGLLDEFDVSTRFFFYPAKSNPHKNHLGLVEAFGRLVQHKEFEDVHLVFSGSKTPFYDNVERLIAELGIGAHIRHVGFISRHNLIGLMTLASALVFPSEFEGFGLPLLEAMQCNTPVLASNRASIPEVAGDAALLLPPHDRANWHQAMAQVLADKKLAHSLVERGARNLDRFSWACCAAQTLAILQQTS